MSRDALSGPLFRGWRPVGAVARDVVRETAARRAGQDGESDDGADQSRLREQRGDGRDGRS